MTALLPPPPSPPPDLTAPLPVLRPLRQPSNRPPIGELLAAIVALLVVLAVGWLLLDKSVPFKWYEARQGELAHDLEAARPEVRVGDALGVLQVPAIGLNAVVVEGDRADVLRGAPGHHHDSPVPGAEGNAVVFGHRHGWGAPFEKLNKLVVGDQLVFQPKNALPLLFKVVSTARVADTDTAPFAPSTDHRLTLVTGTSDWTGLGRLVVTAVSGKVAEPTASGGAAVGPRRRGVVLPALAGLLAAVSAVVVGIIWLRRRGTSAGVTAVVVAPFVLAAGVALLLQVDSVLPPLR
jgi:LPXTG-site transpeptidase (sortase) family protein